MVRYLRSWKCRDRSKEQSCGVCTLALSGVIGPSTIHTNSMGNLGWLLPTFRVGDSRLASVRLSVVAPAVDPAVSFVHECSLRNVFSMVFYADVVESVCFPLGVTLPPDRIFPAKGRAVAMETKRELRQPLFSEHRWHRCCKYYTSNDVFSRCKSVHKMATGNSDDELIQHDNKMRIGTRSGKFRKVENRELSMAWWQSKTRTPMTTSMLA